MGRRLTRRHVGKKSFHRAHSSLSRRKNRQKARRKSTMVAMCPANGSHNRCHIRCFDTYYAKAHVMKIDFCCGDACVVFDAMLYLRLFGDLSSINDDARPRILFLRPNSVDSAFASDDIHRQYACFCSTLNG